VCRDKCRRLVVELCTRSGEADGNCNGDRITDQGNRSSPAVAVAQAAALLRLAIVALLLMRVANEVRRGLMRRRMRMCASQAALLEGETTVHRTGVQLHRLDQTKGEPKR
jgi:hypothetical protein